MRRKVETDTKGMRCDECGKLFLTEHQLSQHESKHEVEVAARGSRDRRYDYYIIAISS